MCARGRKLPSEKWKNPIIKLKYSAVARFSIRTHTPL